MNHPPEQILAAEELLADGLSPVEAAERICETFGVSMATAHRRVRHVRDNQEWEEPPTNPESVDYLAMALGCVSRAMKAAEESGDLEAAVERAKVIGDLCAKNRIRRA